MTGRGVAGTKGVTLVGAAQKEKEELEVEEEGGLLGTFVSDAHITIGTAIINIEFFFIFH